MLSVPSLNTGTVICIITRLSTIGFFQVLAVTFVMQRDVDFLHFPSNSPRVFLDRHVLLVSSYIFSDTNVFRSSPPSPIYFTISNHWNLTRIVPSLSFTSVLTLTISLQSCVRRSKKVKILFYLICEVDAMHIQNIEWNLAK